MPYDPRKFHIPLLLASILSFPALAEQAGKPLAEKLQAMDLVITASIDGCDEDIKQHCDGLGDNADKIFMCLAAYEDHLSTACKQGIVEAALAVRLGAAALEYSISACEADADEYCLDVEPGEGRMLKCIRENNSRVSKACVAALKETGLWDLGN